MSIQEPELALRGGAASKRRKGRRKSKSTGNDASFLNDEAIATPREDSQHYSTESLPNISRLENEAIVRHSNTTQPSRQELKPGKPKRFIAFIGERGSSVSRVLS